MYWMGPSALVGAAVLIFSNPLQTWAMTLLNPIRIQVAKLTDSRMGLVTEILQGIKVIKFFAYEPRYAKHDTMCGAIVRLTWMYMLFLSMFATAKNWIHYIRRL